MNQRSAIAILSVLLGAAAGCSLLLPDHARRAGHVSPCFTAEMVATVVDARSVSRIAAGDGKLRVEVIGGRQSSVMIASYDSGTARVLVPQGRRYAEFPLASVGDHIPHFLMPGIRIEKEFLGEERIEGKQARKYRARVIAAGKQYNGYLWEAVNLPGYPLKWEDEARRVTAFWRNGRIAPVPKSLFDVPEGFTLLSAGKEEAAGRENRRVKRRAKDHAVRPAGADDDQ